MAEEIEIYFTCCCKSSQNIFCRCESVKHFSCPYLSGQHRFYPYLSGQHRFYPYLSGQLRSYHLLQVMLDRQHLLLVKMKSKKKKKNHYFKYLDVFGLFNRYANCLINACLEYFICRHILLYRMPFQCTVWPFDVLFDHPKYGLTYQCTAWHINVLFDLYICTVDLSICTVWPIKVLFDLSRFRLTYQCTIWPLPESRKVSGDDNAWPGWVHGLYRPWSKTKC